MIEDFAVLSAEREKADADISRGLIGRRRWRGIAVRDDDIH
jgi:hypothetical protein